MFTSPYRHHRVAFTLIELLVVLSIIALLVGILLPSLANARQAATAVACQSNLRQIGIGLMSYSNSYDESMPFSWIERSGAIGATRASAGLHRATAWWVPVSVEMGISESDANREVVVGGTSGYAQLSDVFVDGDTESGVSGGPAQAHYVINERICPFRDLDDPLNFTRDPFTGGIADPMRVSEILNPSSAGLVWDGPQLLNDTHTFGRGSTWPRSDFVDGFRVGFFDWWGLLTDNTGGWAQTNYDLPLAIGSDGSPASRSRAGQERYNVDWTGYAPADGFQNNAFRFRHMNNTQLNMLFVDGHVEPRLLGALTARDIAVDVD